MSMNAWILSGTMAVAALVYAALPERPTPLAEMSVVVLEPLVVRTYTLANAEAERVDHLLTRVYQPSSEGAPAVLRVDSYDGRLVVRAEPRVHDEVAALIGEIDAR